MSDRVPVSPARKLLGRLAATVLGVLTGAVTAEVGFRAYLTATADGYSAERTREAIASARTSLSGGIGGNEEDVSGAQLQPLLGWWDSILQRKVDQLYRKGSRTGLEPEGTKEANRDYIVWVLGGSVAALFGREDVGGVREFEQRLAADPRFRAASGGRAPRVFGLGHASYKQPQQANLVTFLFGLGLEPDAILNLDGFNEVAVASSNADMGVHPGYPAVNQWGGWARNPLSDPERFGLLVETWNARTETLRLAEMALDRGLTRSAVAGTLLLGRIESARDAWSETVGRYVSQSLSPEEIPALRGPALDRRFALDAMLRVWFESSRVLHAVCEDRGLFYLHALQPTLHDEGAKPWTEEERKTSRASKSWLKGVKLGYPRLRELGALLAAEGIAFHDASFVFEDVNETLYYDACHFNRAGNDLLARDLAAAFAAGLAR